MLQAFNRLSASRQLIQGAEAHIQVDQIIALARAYGIDEPDETLEFVDSIQAIDNVYLAERQKRREAEAAKKKPEGST